MSVLSAAEHLAACARANIKACYRLNETRFLVDRCEQPPWSEEALRRSAAHAVSVADAETTHVAMLDALLQYDNAVQIQKLADETRKLTETVADLQGRVFGVFDGIEQKLKESRPAALDRDPP